MDETPLDIPDLPDPLPASDDEAPPLVRLMHAVRRAKDRAKSLVMRWLDYLLLIEKDTEPAEAEGEWVFDDDYGTLTLMELDPPAAPILGYDPAQDEPAGPYDEQPGSSDIGDWLDRILLVRRPSWWESEPAWSDTEFIPEQPAEEPEPPPNPAWALPAGLIVTSLALIPLITFRDRYPAEWLTWKHVPAGAAVFGAVLALSALRDACPARFLVHTAHVVASFALGLCAIGLVFFPLALHHPLTGLELALIGAAACLGSALATVTLVAVVTDDERLWQPVDEWLDRPAPAFVTRAWFRVEYLVLRAGERGSRSPRLAALVQPLLPAFNAPARRILWTALSGTLDRFLGLDSEECASSTETTPAAEDPVIRPGGVLPAPRDLGA